MTRLTLVAVLLAASWARALPETAAYAQDRRALAESYYFDHRVMETLVGRGGVHLSAVSFPTAASDVAVVILGGRTESHLKYTEVFYDLRDWGYSLYMYDHRGQGLSQRLLEDPERQHVEHFQDYVDDLGTFLDTVVARGEHRKVFILAHSMGGLIATRLLERETHAVDALVLCAPMHRFYTAPFPEPVAQGLGWGGVLTAQGDEYGLTQGGFEHGEFADNRVSRSRVRWEFNQALPDRYPQLRMGGVTYRWVQQAFGAAGSARREARRLLAPTLILQSGADTVVRNDGQDAVCRAARDCTRQQLPGARHELLMEIDATRDEVLSRAHAFLEQQRTNDWHAEVTGCTSAGGAVGWAVLVVALGLARRRR
ncbi:MAG: alpha/beta fold hydrolase [Deltaproteobacteria bacterium]|nr:alpha/beta fold hydrolase [Deltaproteobacteria bacterium]